MNPVAPVAAMVDRRREDGPTLQQYVETRFNLLTEHVHGKTAAQDELLALVRVGIHDALEAMDLRYQQRFEAQSAALAAAFESQQQAMRTAFVVAEKAVQAALAAADRAVAKAEGAADKRFDALNELRQMLNDMVGNLMPRIEATQRFDAIADKVQTTTKAVDGLLEERKGVRGGWGYAVGAVSLFLMLMTVVGFVINNMRSAP